MVMIIYLFFDRIYSPQELGPVSNAANWGRKIDDFAILSTLSTRPWGKNIILCDIEVAFWDVYDYRGTRKIWANASFGPIPKPDDPNLSTLLGPLFAICCYLFSLPFSF